LVNQSCPVITVSVIGDFKIVLTTTTTLFRRRCKWIVQTWWNFHSNKSG